ncbi:hypothetical protein GUJ93_ZPchr0006g42951 [Zizania palustris]|uniref:Uncharacterized protein n=1 Tax=Zizania palustris TaxID=103762 RepID=A0A8J5SHP6_ZIZPA|nr:hypothetical protein GUJ93_ZPchr0006g42951 [Zizania palustris]
MGVLCVIPILVLALFWILDYVEEILCFWLLSGKIPTARESPSLRRLSSVDPRSSCFVTFASLPEASTRHPALRRRLLPEAEATQRNEILNQSRPTV